MWSFELAWHDVRYSFVTKSPTSFTPTCPRWRLFPLNVVSKVSFLFKIHISLKAAFALFSQLHFYQNEMINCFVHEEHICCVYQPVNKCFAHHWLVVINFFTSFSGKTKKEEKAQPKGKKHKKRSIWDGNGSVAFKQQPVFECQPACW